ncbi:RNA-processing protein [Candidatus Woesearchaeota archaeon]|nr:RNA-processing protein [Candidatus Woesearchaeota archaeon]
MDEFSYDIKIPRDRIAVLIGKNGEVKKNLEEVSHTKIAIDSKEGDVVVSGEDAITLYSTKNVIRAIARGFNPEVAQLLLRHDYVFDVLDVTTYIKNKNHLERVKGRVIGKEGKAREILEQLTDTHISVYGKTICIIGLGEFVNIARRAIESLLVGSPHAKVYMWLEKQRKELKRRMFEDEFAMRDKKEK